MQGDDEIIELLNEVLTAELTAVNQYFLDARMLGNWGYERLGKKFYDESLDEMKDADQLIERILYLDGMPNLQRLGTVRVGETAPEKLSVALDLEKAAIERLNRGIALCTSKGDNGSRDLLEDILEGEEEHADWLESQLELISQVGEAHYLAQQIRE
jgi:bacterioferritin